MPLNKLQFNPGINKEVTQYSNEAGWNDCDKVRFRQGYPEKIGGWRRYGKNTFTGVCRSLHQWVSNAFVKYIGLGTNVKFFVEEGTIYYDITPIRLTATLGSNPITTVNTSTSVTVAHTSHGATLGSYVTLSGVSGTINNVPASDLNKEHVITEIVNDNSYKVVVATTANGNGSGGGSSVVATYQINAGPDFQIPTQGWDSLDWDGSGWNGSANSAEELRVWNQANFGEDLIIGPRGGELYYWDTGSATFDGSAKTATRAVTVKDVNNGSAVSLTKTSTGNINENFAYITNVDAAVGATIRVGDTVTCTTASRIPAGTTVLSVSANNTVVNLSANPINTSGGTLTGLTFNFNTDPISVASNSKTITVFDPTLERVYEVGQHVTLAGATTVSGITNTVINARHKIATVDSASNTYTIDISGAEPASATTSGGGASVTAQYELSAEVPVVQNHLLVSDSSRFVFCFGCNAFGDTTETLNPMLIRWSDQEDMFDWRPRSTNQAGDIQLSQGTEIVTTLQSRQEILVFTDAALYSLQYVGAPVVWSSQLMGSNMSVISSKAAAYANGVAYWMGIGKFYKYDGAVQPLRCDVRKFVFDDMNLGQQGQVFAGSLEEYHEIWWFYVSKSNTAKIAPDKYVVYNYAEDIWYVGTLDRSAWLDSPINDFPLAATNTYNLVEHENGNDDGQAATTQPINAHITSGKFGIESGNSFTFVDKLVPDMSFVGSDSNAPNVDFALFADDAPGRERLGSDSVGGNAEQPVYVLSVTNVDNYTDIVNIRMRGRDMAIKISSDSLGTRWQLGTPRLNMRPDGRRGRT
jgi:hypothetical protein